MNFRRFGLVIILLLAGVFILVGCGGGSSKSGPSVLTLKSESALDGHIAHFSGGTNRYVISNATSYFQTGCAYNGGDATRVGFKGYLSFNLGSVPANVTIASVTLRVYQSNFSGDPYGLLGNLLVEHVSYNTFVNEADGTALYTMSVLDATIPPASRLSTDSTLGYKTIDVTEAVKADLAASRGRSQFRICFENETATDTSTNFVVWLSGESNTNQPELVVQYN